MGRNNRRGGQKVAEVSQVVDQTVEAIETIDMTQVEAVDDDEVGEVDDTADEGVSTVEQGLAAIDKTRTKEVADPNLPKISELEIPKMTTLSARIRWLAAAGYTRSQIATFTGKRYQHVRNVLLKEPKRAAQEALPEVKRVLRDDSAVIRAMQEDAERMSVPAPEASDESEAA